MQVGLDELGVNRNAKGNRGFFGRQPKSVSQREGQAHPVGECQRGSKPFCLSSLEARGVKFE